jgi:hypothetical protein
MPPHSLSLCVSGNEGLVMENLIKWIIGISGTTLGIFLGYFIRLFIEHRLAIDRIKENIKITEFNKAASELRSAFAKAIVKFRILSDFSEIDEMLKEELIPQGIAIEKFRPFVPKNKQKSYQEAWENYHQSHKREGTSSVYFLDYAMVDEKKRFKLFDDRIKKILEFAEN